MAALTPVLRNFLLERFEDMTSVYGDCVDRRQAVDNSTSTERAFLIK